MGTVSEPSRVCNSNPVFFFCIVFLSVFADPYFPYLRLDGGLRGLGYPLLHSASVTLRATNFTTSLALAADLWREVPPLHSCLQLSL